MRLRKLLVAVALALSTSCVPVPQAPAQQITSIIYVTVIDVATGKKLPDQVLVLQGDRIVSVSAADDLAAAPQGRVIDAHGSFLIPGLWDMHVHVQDLEDLPLYIANGITGVRMMSGTKNTKELRGKLAIASVSPEIIVASAILDGDPPIWPGSIIVHKPDDARRIVDEVKSGGADFVKVYNGIPRDAYFARADEAHKQNIPFVGHLPFEIRASEASDAGQHSIEYLPGIAIACSKREQGLMRELRPLHYMENTNLIAEAIRSFDAAQCQTLFAQFRRNPTPRLLERRGASPLTA